VQQGVLFADFTLQSGCSQIRSMLMSCVDNYLAGLGNMGELLSDNQNGKQCYEDLYTLEFDVIYSIIGKHTFV